MTTLLVLSQRDSKGRFIKGFGGSKHWNWKGGKWKMKLGYIVSWTPDHPAANADGYVYEHRLVMEQHLGRYLTKDEVVHHINGIKSDNRIENLALISDNPRHMRQHGDEHRKNVITKRICSNCANNKTLIDKYGYHIWFRNPSIQGEFLCRQCYRKYYS